MASQRRREMLKINENQLINRFRSKRDIYNYLTSICKTYWDYISSNIVNVYLPGYGNINKDFLRQILAEEKKVFKRTEIKTIKIPMFDELSVKNLWDEVKDDPKVMAYLPDIKDTTKHVEREFFHNILNTVHPAFMDDIVKHAYALRNKPELDEEKKDYILISDDWFD